MTALRSNLDHMSWTEDEDDLVMAALRVHPVGAWGRLASGVPRRSADMVQARVEAWLGAAEVARYTGVRVALRRVDGVVTWAESWPDEHADLDALLQNLVDLYRKRAAV